MTVDEMKEKKRQLGYSSEKLAELSGVPLGTVQKIFGGFTKAPRYKTLQALEKVFVEAEQKEDLSTGAYVPGKQNVMMVHEPAATYHTGGMKGQGEYTIEDYFSLPEEKRAELIDGVFYDMASPSVIHQLIAGQIFVQLNVFLRKKKASPKIRRCQSLSIKRPYRCEDSPRTTCTPIVIISFTLLLLFVMIVLLSSIMDGVIVYLLLRSV